MNIYIYIFEQFVKYNFNNFIMSENKFPFVFR